MHEACVKASLGTLGPRTRVFLLTGLPFTFHSTEAAANPAPTSSSRFTEWTRTKMLRERSYCPGSLSTQTRLLTGSCPLRVCELQKTQPLPRGKVGVSELSWEFGNLLSAAGSLFAIVFDF